MRPELTSSHFPYVPISLDAEGYSDSIEALIDTGFDGDLAIPTATLTSRPARYTPWSFADGSTVFAPTYDGILRIGNFEPLRIVLIAVGEEVIVGRGVTDRFMVVLDHGQRVLISA